MENIIVYIIIIAIAYFLLSSPKNKVNNSKNNDNTHNEDDTDYIKYDKNKAYNEALKKAHKITTYKQLEALDDKIIRTEERLSHYEEEGKDKQYEKTYVELEILTEAYSIAEYKPYRYYIQYIDIDTPLEVLNMVGKLITPKVYDKLDDKIKDYFEEILLMEAINTDETKQIVLDVMQQYEEELKVLKSFQKIITSDMDDQEKEKKFNKLIRNNVYLQEELAIDLENNISPFEQYKDILMRNETFEAWKGIPYKDVLYNAGYRTIQDLKNVSDTELLSIKGIGKKTLARIRNVVQNS
jgi:hypothetical protein